MAGRWGEAGVSHRTGWALENQKSTSVRETQLKGTQSQRVRVKIGHSSGRIKGGFGIKEVNREGQICIRET